MIEPSNEGSNHEAHRPGHAGQSGCDRHTQQAASLFRVYQTENRVDVVVASGPEAPVCTPPKKDRRTGSEMHPKNQQAGKCLYIACKKDRMSFFRTGRRGLPCSDVFHEKGKLISKSAGE
jgi:hypothetical protein